MKRTFLVIVILAGVGIATAIYFRPGGSPEGNRDLYLKRARDYISQAKMKEAVSEFRKALKADPASAEGHHELGLALLKLGDRGDALQEFRRASNLKPHMLQPRYQLVDLYLQDRDVRRAKEQLLEIQRLEPNSVEAYQIAAKLALVEKDPDTAVAELEEALKKTPNNVSLYVDAASIYAGKKDFKRAEEFYRKALEIDPKWIQARVALPRLYLAMGEQARAEQELILATKADPENEKLLHFQAAYPAGMHKFDVFEELYLSLLKQKPDSLVAKKRLAEFYILKGDLQKGWAYTHEIHKAHPGDPDATYFYGRLHLAQKEWARAAEVLFYAARNAPNFALARYFLGLAHLGNNDIAQAQVEFAKALELDALALEPRAALARIYLTRGDYGLAWRESEAILQAQPRNAEILIIAGVALLKKGEASRALDLFHRVKDLVPGDTTLHINIAEAYAVQKKYGQALTTYEEALKLDPDRIDALGSIAQVLVIQGNQKAAFERVQQQLAKTRNKAEVYQLLGQLSVDQKDYAKARSYLEKAVTLKPDLFSAAHLIATSYMAQEQFDQAIAESEKIIQKNPGAISAYMLLGVLYDRKQQYDKANTYYRKVLDLDKNSALAANSLAWNYVQYGGNLDAALTLAQKARELSPNNERIAHTLGWIYYKRGLYLRAVGLLKESSEKFKDSNPTVLYHLGMAYSKKGDTTLAKESLIKALKLNQSFSEAKEAKQALDEIGASNVTASEAHVYLETGLIRLKKHDPKGAEGAFKKALEIDPKYIRARVALATLYLAMGSQEKGEQELLLAAKSDPENEELLHILGTYGSGMRRVDDYENLYKDILQKRPDSIAAKKKLTELFIVKGELEKASAYAHALRKARPGDTDVSYFYGRLHLAQNQYNQAAEEFLQVTRHLPRFAPTYYFLGLTWLGTNDTRQAQIAFTQAKDLNPVWLEPRAALARIYLTRGDYGLAWRESEAILQAQPRNAEILIIAGVALLKKGEASRALDLFHRVKDLVPGDTTLHINIAEAYAVQKKYGQALTTYEEALKLDPDRIDALGSIAQVLVIQGNQKAAFERVQQQLAKTRNKAEVYQLLGQLSVDQKDYAKARSYLEKAVTLKPDLFSAAHLIATSYMAQEQFDQAIAESEKIIQKNPGAISAYMLLGVLYDRKQQYDKANTYYRKVLDLDKNSALAANSLAWNYVQYGGNLDAALTLAQKARELSPNNERIAHTLGWIYYKMGGYRTAINLLRESSDKFKHQNPTVLYHLGLAYRKIDDNGRAKESFSNALKLNQDFRESKQTKQALDAIADKNG